MDPVVFSRMPQQMASNGCEPKQELKRGQEVSSVAQESIKKSASLNDLKSASAPKEEKRKKSVSFDNLVRVTLIPHVTEYHEAKLGKHLWWNVQDFQQFQLAAYQHHINPSLEEMELSS